MIDYDKPRLPRILFGNGKSANVINIVKEFDIKKCLVVTDKGVRQLGIVDKILKNFAQEGIAYQIFDDVMPNPADYLIVDLAKNIKQNEYDGIIAIGGGSPMDTAKAAALIASFSKDPGTITRLFDYNRPFGKYYKENWKRTIPVITVTTTAGTSAEVTASTAITDTETGNKFSFGNEAIAPDVAIVDPELTVGMPARPTANGALDALAHALEIVVGVTKNEYTNMILFSCIEKVWKWLPIAVKEPNNLEARVQLSWAAHNSLANAGSPNGHAVAHAIGGLYHMVHGHACAVTLPTVVRHHAVTSQAEIAKTAEIMGIQTTGNAQADADLVANEIKAFYKQFGFSNLEESIKASGSDDNMETFVKKAIPLTLVDWKSRLWNPPIHENEEDCGKILRMIYEDK